MFGLKFDPTLIEQILTVLAGVTAGGVSLFLAGWLVLQALKKEVPALRKFIVRAVIGLATLLVVSYLVVPILFVALVCIIMVAALFLGGDAIIKRMTGQGGPPDKPAT